MSDKALQPTFLPPLRYGKNAAELRRQSSHTPDMVETVAHPIYQLKITLAGVRPPVWRRLRVPNSINLKKLHQIL
jgi:hypothetical protein